MKSNIVKETKTAGEEIRALVLDKLKLEPEVVHRFSQEIDRLRKDLGYRKAPPLEKLMIEQVLVSHAQNLVALYKLETIPINADIPFQHKYLDGRVTTTQGRLIRSVCILSGLEKLREYRDWFVQARSLESGMGQHEERFPVGERPPQQFTKQELKGSPVDYLDEDPSPKEDERIRAEKIRKYWADREARWQAYEETEEDKKPRRLVRIVYRNQGMV